MGDVASAPTVAAVVAAYNEAGRLGPVLEVLASYPGFDEVVVVDDGSTDATAAVAGRYPVTCLRLETNGGKGAALEAGVRHAGTEVLFFADADIRGLDHRMIDQLLEPVVAGEVDMFVAMRRRSIYLVRSVLTFLPLLGGERALTAKLWHAVPSRYRHRFRIEAALNFYAVHFGRGLRYRVFSITQTRKESKHGLLRGALARARMAADVGVAIVDVQANEAPLAARRRRRAAATGATATAVLVLAARSAAGAARDQPGAGAVPRAAARGAAVAGLGVAAGAVALGQLVRLAQSPARSGD